VALGVAVQVEEQLPVRERLSQPVGGVHREGGFADASLPTDQHCPPLSGRSHAQKLRQLPETVLTFEKVHRASSAFSKYFRAKIPGKRD